MKSAACCCWALLLGALASGAGSKSPAQFKNTPLCELGPELRLDGHGQTASAGVALDPLADRPECEVRVVAPPTHVIGLVFDRPKVGATSRRGNESEEELRTEQCVMRIYLPDKPDTPFWKGDPCSGGPLPEVDLLTNDFRIVWTPPDNPWNTAGRTFYLTAIGSGPVCQEPFQLACLRIGRVPMLCVSKGLACDGRRHCPRAAGPAGGPAVAPDEDPRLCRPPVAATGSWEGLLREIVKGFKPPVNGSTGDSTWSDWQHNKNGTNSTPAVVEENHNAGETISQMLNKYGPWGYLMLGLLICGTVLFFCGLWECCCRKPKAEADPPLSAPPTTVLVMDCGAGVPPRPPDYDDLDLPPSYGTLFPHVVRAQQEPQAAEAPPKEEGGSSSEEEERSQGDTVT